jgi:hypothetical protein
VVFDYNAPIDTPEVHNTLDSQAPSSSVMALPATTTNTVFTVSWSGEDESGGSGIASYDLYVQLAAGGKDTRLKEAVTTELLELFL